MKQYGVKPLEVNVALSVISRVWATKWKLKIEDIGTFAVHSHKFMGECANIKDVVRNEAANIVVFLQRRMKVREDVWHTHIFGPSTR